MDLEQVRPEEREIDYEERASDRDGVRSRPPPDLACHEEEQDGRDRHRHRDRDTVRRRQVARCAEAEYEPDGGEHQRPVDAWDVDLADLRGRCVGDAHRWPVPKLY